MENKTVLMSKSIVLLEAIKQHISEIEQLELTNEQFFIDFEDTLNKLSIKDHANLD